MVTWGVLMVLVVAARTLYPGDIGDSPSGGPHSLPFIRGLRVYNSAAELLPPFLIRSPRDTLGFANQLTIEFDVDVNLVPDLEIAFYHCDRDWVVDDNEFLRNEFHNRSFTLDYSPAPLGAKHYTYRFVNRFPDPHGIVQFPFSGNYLFYVVDRESGDSLATGRIVVIDPLADVNVSVEWDFISEAVAPMNQAHRVRTKVSIPEVDLSDSMFVRELHDALVTTVDIYQNHNLNEPYRVVFYDSNVWTSAEWIAPYERIFEYRRILPGNHYRQLDITNERLYPRGSLARLVTGVDLPRYLWQGMTDLRGGSKLRPVSGIESDYLQVEFRLRIEPRPSKDVFVVGSFNQWTPSAKDRLPFDRSRGIYVVSKWLRRGVYDYSYILGWWDPGRSSVVGQDRFALEGNHWQTVRDYYAVVYYDDPRYGGFDRIIGIGKGTSPGGTSATVE